MENPLNRRNFLAASIAAAAVPLAQSAVAAEGENAGGGRQYYELRKYHFRRGPMTKRADEYFRNAMIPALRRHGCGPVGVFNVMVGPDSPTLYVLIPHRSASAFGDIAGRLAEDREFQTAAAAYLERPATDPPYVRMESSLLAAFTGMPRLEPPPGVAEKRARIFELRTYESHNERAGRKKIEMFNTGEIAIFRRTGLRPVFFGETLVGTRMPNLTYMLAFDDLPGRDKAWGQFVADPEWHKLSTTPGYTDPEIVTSISNVLLRPTSYSQV